MNIKHHWNRDIDDAIRKLYTSTPKRGAVAKFARGIGYPATQISLRALALGVRSTSRPETPWTQPEIALLREHHWRSLITIQRYLRAAGFKRSMASIAAARRARIEARHEQSHFTPWTLARLCGVHVGTVQSWLEVDELPCVARRRGEGPPQPGEDRVIPLVAFRAWLAEHPHRLDLRKVDQAWFWRSIVLPVFRASRRSAQQSIAAKQSTTSNEPTTRNVA